MAAAKAQITEAGGVLPGYHVRRPRLVKELEKAPVAVVEAGGGYGKTMLGAELSRASGNASVSVLLGPTDGQPGALVARLISALKRVRLAELAAAVQAEHGDPVAAVDALGAVLVSKDEDFALLTRRLDPAPTVMWLRIGNTSRRALLAWLDARLPEIVGMLDAGERLVEVR